MKKKSPRNKYDSHVAPRLEEVKAWARDGATEEEIAKKLGGILDVEGVQESALGSFGCFKMRTRVR